MNLALAAENCKRVHVQEVGGSLSSANPAALDAIQTFSLWRCAAPHLPAGILSP